MIILAYKQQNHITLQEPHNIFQTNKEGQILLRCAMLAIIWSILLRHIFLAYLPTYFTPVLLMVDLQTLIYDR